MQTSKQLLRVAVIAGSVFKGAAVSIGAAVMGHAAFDLEAAPDLDRAAALVDTFADTAQATMVEVEQLMGHPPGDRAIA